MQSVAIITLLLCVSPVLAQYGSEPFIEGYVGANLTVPTGNLKNNLTPDSLNAKMGYGLDLGIAYYLKPQLALGIYFNSRNMKTSNFDLYHRVFEVGASGKYLLSDLSNSSMSPYLKITAGASFSKFAQAVEIDGGTIYREISHAPVLGLEAALGIQAKLKKDNQAGGVFLEAAVHNDFVDKSEGKFLGVGYPWSHGNALYFMLRGGVFFNIGRKE